MNDRRLLLGYLGGGLLITGTFLPLVTLPIVGSLNYFANGNGDGRFIIGYAIVGLVLTALKKYRWLLIPAIAAIAQLTYALVTFQQKMAEATAGLEGNPFAGLLADSVHLDWAWIVLYLGALATGVAAILKAPAVPVAEPEA